MVAEHSRDFWKACDSDEHRQIDSHAHTQSSKCFASWVSSVLLKILACPLSMPRVISCSSLFSRSADQFLYHPATDDVFFLFPACLPPFSQEHLSIGTVFTQPMSSSLLFPLFTVSNIFLFSTALFRSSFFLTLSVHIHLSLYPDFEFHLPSSIFFF